MVPLILGNPHIEGCEMLPKMTPIKRTLLLHNALVASKHSSKITNGLHKWVAFSWSLSSVPEVIIRLSDTWLESEPVSG